LCGEDTRKLYKNGAFNWPKIGLGTTYPNPMVGSVLVYKGKIIGEGWHHTAGEPHAEVMAIRAVKDKTLLKKLNYLCKP